MLKAILARITGRQATTAPAAAQDELYSRLWWILDPTHAHHCEDCKRMAANSPYFAPGSGGNELRCTCGDGSTACGPDCTCILSYAPPGPNNPDMARFQQERPIAKLFKTYTHGQVRFIEEYGLEATYITIHSYVDALALSDGSLVKPSEYQCFLTTEDGATVQLWEYPPEIPFPPDGKWRKRFEEGRRLVAQWPVERVRWVLNPHALRRYEETALDVPEWCDDDGFGPVDETIASRVLSIALEATREKGCTVAETPGIGGVRPSYHHVGYDVRMHGTRTVMFKNGASRERFAFLYVHVVPLQDIQGERYVVRSCLMH